MRDSHGVWEYDRSHSMIRRRKVPGKDTIGDIRITYQVPSDYEAGRTAKILGTVRNHDAGIERLPYLKTCVSTKSMSARDFANQNYSA